LDALWYVLVVVYSLVCIALIVVIMLQKGKGAGFAGAFGLGPGSETIFGPRGSKSLPVRLTRIGAGLFIFLAFVLSALSGHVGQGAAPDEITTEESAAMNDLKSLGLGEQSGEETVPAPATESPEAPAAPVEGAAAPVVEAPAPEAAPAVEAPAAEPPAEGAAQ
jgi:preprotein translocase subunit SecG